MIKKVFEITSENGVHSRSAAILVSISSKFKSDIKFLYKTNIVDLKSIIGVMSLAVDKNSIVSIEIDGIDEFEAMTEIAKIFATSNLGKEVR